MKIFNIVSDEKNMDSLAHMLKLSQHQLNISVIATHCHIILKVDPISIKAYDFLSNSFQDGMFDNVQSLGMTDIYPFEHNFFNVISQSFPLLKDLCILNEKPQKNKQQSTTLIVFSHLILLSLSGVHSDYAEQFLVDKRCYLPCLLNINIRYEPLALVTNNFTNDATPLTCSKLTSVCIKEPFVSPETFSKYFPLL